MEVVKKLKSRNQSIFEFFETLQVEWLCADLRSRIYPKIKDKEYWKRVKDGKQQTIENIAEKNKLPTVFTDQDLLSALEARIYRSKGYPIFAYRNEEQRQLQEPLDLLYYYNKGVEVRCEIFGETKVGKVESYIPYNQVMQVRFIDTVRDLAVDEVTRIL